MRKRILKLRIVGIVTFLLYLLSVMFTASEDTSYTLTQVQQLLTFISVVCFAIVMAMQVYVSILKLMFRKKM